MVYIEKIRKRDGSVVSFDRTKISLAIDKAAQCVGYRDRTLCDSLADMVTELLIKRNKLAPTVEEAQDTVEEVLIQAGHTKIAKSYILYRQQRTAIRQEKMHVLEKQDLDDVDKVFDVNALRVLKARYLRKDESGKLVETPKQLFTRIAVHDALPDVLYDPRIFDYLAQQTPSKKERFDLESYAGVISIGIYPLNQYHLDGLKRMYDRMNKEKKMRISWSAFFEMLQQGAFNQYEATIDTFYNLMVSKKFMPNTPAIANFGNALGMGSACFVLGIEDSMESIMDTLKATAIIHKSGGGTGFNFSQIRPEGDYVSSTSGVASGPLSFMRLFDTMTEVVKQGGIRRGANMGIMNSNHPDIEKFITSKDGNKGLRNFNISVLIMPDFWSYYDKNEPYPLLNPRTGKVVKTVNPRELFDRMVYQAWESAEPGVIFFDRVNDYNPFYKHLGPVVTTNPCVAADTLIPTLHGLERIDSLRAEDIVIDTRTIEHEVAPGVIALQRGTQLVKPLQIMKTGIKKVCTLITTSGYEVVATPDHKILTERGWVPLGDIQHEDKVYIQSGAGQFREEVPLPFTVCNEIIGENGRKYTFNLPAMWDFDIGLVLGWLTGDGFINTKYTTIGFVFAPNDREARQRIQPILEQYFNRKLTARNYENGCIQLRSNSKPIVDFFLNLGYNPDEREVPESLFTASKSAVLGFLTGLFSSDGTIMGTKSRNYIRLNSSSLKLLKQVQLLLLNLGVKTTIYNRSTKPKVFFYKDMHGADKTYQTSGENYELNISKQNVGRFLELVTFLQTKNKAKIEELKQFEFYQETFMDRIQSISPSGEKEVWDITEPLTHSFIANGIVVHNCGEVLLYPNEPCNLGSINVWAFAKHDEQGKAYVDWESMKETVICATKFLDNVIDVNKFPLQAIEDMSLATRKIGLGIMGVADLLYELRLPYNSDEGREFMGKLMEFVNYYSKVESIRLAKERGNIPYYTKSFYPEGRLPFAGYEGKTYWNFDWKQLCEEAKTFMRNGFTTVIAPTGSISMIAGCSSGIEPVYTLVWEKHVAVGSFFYTDPVFERVMKEEGYCDERLLEDIHTHNGTIQKIDYIPSHLKRVFITAMDTTPDDHIRALAEFQRWTDSSISKTNNFPADATVEMMRESYILAYKLGCKDVTVFRDSSIKSQVLRAPTKKEAKPVAPITEVAEVSSAAGSLVLEQQTNQSVKQWKVCPECNAALEKKEGCVTCSACGWGVCS